MPSNRRRNGSSSSHFRAPSNRGSSRLTPEPCSGSASQEDSQQLGDTWGQGGPPLPRENLEQERRRQSQATEQYLSAPYSHRSYSSPGYPGIDSPYGQAPSLLPSPIQYPQTNDPNSLGLYPPTLDPNALDLALDSLISYPRVFDEYGGFLNSTQGSSSYLDDFSLEDTGGKVRDAVSLQEGRSPYQSSPQIYNQSPYQNQQLDYSRGPAVNYEAIPTQESRYWNNSANGHQRQEFGSPIPHKRQATVTAEREASSGRHSGQRTYQRHANRCPAPEAQYDKGRSLSQRGMVPLTTNPRGRKYPRTLAPEITVSPVDVPGNTVSSHPASLTIMGGGFVVDQSFSEEYHQGGLRAPRSRDRQVKDRSRSRVLTPQGKEDAKTVRRNGACQSCHDKHKKVCLFLLGYMAFWC